MGFEDRDYYREGPRSGAAAFFSGIGWWLLYGRVSLFHFRSIHVQAHSSLFVAMALMLLQLLAGFTWADYLISIVLLFVIVLLHEFGHCFGCRFVGGDADEIVMHPLGGLALVRVAVLVGVAHRETRPPVCNARGERHDREGLHSVERWHAQAPCRSAAARFDDHLDSSARSHES